MDQTSSDTKDALEDWKKYPEKSNFIISNRSVIETKIYQKFRYSVSMKGLFGKIEQN